METADLRLLKHLTPAARRRIAFVSLNLAGLFVAWIIVIAPILRIFSDQSREHERLAELKRQYAAARTSDFPAGGRPSSRSHLPEAAYLPDGTDGSIDAMLQARLKSAAEAAGVRIQSVRALEPRTSGGLRSFAAHLMFSGPLSTVRSVLQDIEAGKPLLFIESASFRVAAAIPGMVLREEPSVEVRLDVVGPVSPHGR